MKNILLKQVVSALVVLVFIGLAFGSGDDSSDSSSDTSIFSETQHNSLVDSESSSYTSEGELFPFRGLLQGTQPGFYLRNKFGDEVVIQGKKVPIPAVNHKFLFEDDHIVSLQQTSEEGDRYFYEGTYTVNRNEDGTILITCSLSDGAYSDPTMNIRFDETDNSFICIGIDSSMPDFELNAID